MHQCMAGYLIERCLMTKCGLNNSNMKSILPTTPNCAGDFYYLILKVFGIYIF